MPPKLSTGGRADPPTEPRPAHNTWPMQNVKKPPGRGKKHCGSGGQNHHVQGQLSELPRMLPQLRERSRNFGNVPEVSPRVLRDFPMGAIGPPRFCEVHPCGNLCVPAVFACMRQRTPVGFMGLINFDTPSLVGGAWEHVRSGSPVSGSTGHVRAGSAPPSPVGQLPPHRDSLRRCHPHSGLPAGRP
jgi:hypothetical protein